MELHHLVNDETQQGAQTEKDNDCANDDNSVARLRIHLRVDSFPEW